MKKMKGLSLVWKISLSMAVLATIMISVVSIVYIRTFTKSAEEETANDLAQSIARLERNMTDNLEDAKAFLNDLFYKQEFSFFLNAKNILSESERNYYISSLQSERINGRYLYNNMFGNFGIYSTNKQINENSYEWQFYMDTLKEKPYYREIIENESVLVYGKVRNMDMVATSLNTKNLNMGDSGNQILPVYKKAYDLNSQEIVGVVEIDLDIARISNSTSLEYKPGVNGNLVLDSSKHILLDTMKMTPELSDAVKRVIQDKEGSAKVYGNGSRYFVTYRMMEEPGLYTVAIMRQDTFQTFLKTGVMQVCVVSGVGLLFMLVLIYYLVHNMLSRLLILDQMMGKVGEGNFEVEINTDTDSVEDEVTRITRSFNRMAARLTDVMKEKVAYEQAQKDAELRALQAQINPHFLYNTLENMRMQCEIDEYYCLGNSLSALGELFRYSISWGGNEVRFEAEWKNMKNYISIMQMRYGDSVTFILEEEEDLYDVIVPKLIIQPLVENSFNHGFKNKLPPWEIRVTAQNSENQLVIIIEDNGNGIEADRLGQLKKCLAENKPFYNEKKRKNSIGVINVKQRINLLCGPGSMLDIQSAKGQGTRITLTIIKQEG